MPIISRNLIKLANRPDRGIDVKHWRAEGIDGRGNRWIHGPFFGTQAEAEAIRDAAWPVGQLEDDEFARACDFILNGGRPEDFVLEDMTLSTYRRRLAKKAFREHASEDQNFVCAIAPYILTFTASQISNVLGITLSKAQKVLDKSTRLNDIICPQLLFDGADAEDID